MKGRLAVVSDDGTKEFLSKMIFDTCQTSVWVGGRWKEDFKGFTRYLDWSNLSEGDDDTFYVR